MAAWATMAAARMMPWPPTPASETVATPFTTARPVASAAAGRLRAPRAQTARHTPQPVQSLVTSTASSPATRAGQPSSTHRPHRLQRSSSTTTLLVRRAVDAGCRARAPPARSARGRRAPPRMAALTAASSKASTVATGTPMPAAELLDVERRSARAVGVQAGAGMALVAGHGGGAVVEHDDQARASRCSGRRSAA